MIYSILHLNTSNFLTAYTFTFTVSRKMDAATKLPFPKRNIGLDYLVGRAS
jgi:hypothetical protein